MTTTKSIQGMQRGGPDIEREIANSPNQDKVAKAVKLDRPPEVNDPVVSAAIEAISEIGEIDGNKLDVKYETSTGMIVMTVYGPDGESVIRQIPPEEAIRMAQHRRHSRAQYLSGLF
ncbi:MAG: flagellar protein FlaG [Myxococcota bacterium]|nr:flagellar protein FlaG [Myxococcota bacterium]